MKRLLLLAIAIFMTSSVCYSMPGYDPNDNEPNIYDNSANMELLNKLKTNFEKKYPPKITVTKDEVIYEYNFPDNAYYDEVVTPYDLQKDNTYHYIKK